MKNKILKTITGVAGAGAFVTSCMLDSINSLPLKIWFACMAWLVLYFYANKEHYSSKVV